MTTRRLTASGCFYELRRNQPIHLTHQLAQVDGLGQDGLLGGAEDTESRIGASDENTGFISVEPLKDRGCNVSEKPLSESGCRSYCRPYRRNADVKAEES